MEQKIHDFIKEVAAKNAGEGEFLQAVEEVAEAIVWLLSPGASYCAGAILPVTGGR